MANITAQEFIENACHYGQKTARWNPKMKQYIYCKKQGIHIFDANKSVKMLSELLNKISELASKGKTILFVSTKPQTSDILKQIKEDTGMPVVSYKWFGGLLTNFSTMKDRIMYMKKLKQEFKTGDITRYTKKEQSVFAKELEKLDVALSGVEDMTRVPDAIFVVDWYKDVTALVEAKKVGIPVLGIADTNADPDLYDYFVPANDDSTKALQYILGYVMSAILVNKKK